MCCGFYFFCCDGCQDDLYCIKRIGYYVGFIVNIFLLIDLNVVINVVDCVIRVVMGVGCIFIMVIGYCIMLLLMFDNCNLGMKMVLVQDMLFIIVSYDIGDFISMIIQILLIVGYNKMIYNDFFFWL